ncbi:hypothetical protein BJD66_gp60 [Gordonia phage Emalyn]|uniref:Uncharacterized protein n=1 Tax=Gordonia phage Emalyn TaxID=1821552 RepID=A0A142KBZ6_9CAUD|nr:hypothetical protein BJD66_gp60 [Gordonia phage Emalyn]AMS03629.1 hypothetical protein SEA_EMALYN_60 [Gordonia phage Emalyn]
MMWPRTHTHAPDGARVHRGELMCRSIRSARYRSTTLTRFRGLCVAGGAIGE